MDLNNLIFIGYLAKGCSDGTSIVSLFDIFKDHCGVGGEFDLFLLPGKLIVCRRILTKALQDPASEQQEKDRKIT